MELLAIEKYIKPYEQPIKRADISRNSTFNDRKSPTYSFFQ